MRQPLVPQQRIVLKVANGIRQVGDLVVLVAMLVVLVVTLSLVVLAESR